MGIFVIIESTPKIFSVSCALFLAGLTTKKVYFILRSAIQILWSGGIYALRR